MQAISKLRAHLGTDFQQRLLDAALLSLNAVDNPLRLNNFSTAFRELVRHVFVHLAPDEEIKKCAWYKPEPTSRTGVTRAHRVGFVIHGGISPAYARDKLDIDIDSERKSVVTAVDALNKFTHVNPATFGVAAGEVETHVADACSALKNVLETASFARKTLATAIEATVEKEVVRTVLQETVAAVDEIASHHFIEDVSLDEVHVLHIGAAEIEFVAHGTLEVELQWGSNSDVRNDIGAVGSDSFPLTLHLVSNVNAPGDVEAVEGSLVVDTSNWYEDDHDRDEEISDLIPL